MRVHGSHTMTKLSSLFWSYADYAGPGVSGYDYRILESHCDNARNGHNMTLNSSYFWSQHDFQICESYHVLEGPAVSRYDLTAAPGGMA
ncbi:hypothetical protein OCC_02942 [Thermococcus litoralis DSM 5473]|uniref:Uncharacterized protein n=1 Tax=Thermococcus litoralis (strain ATCC 51850 / DSM 5473 / JCM 8560 / NS-C) TaxID=523849 RepID=H3ZQ10_THELN|nr:hypothetical protein OCC_02942 [Thermococcus litoralis DSM 5473]